MKMLIKALLTLLMLIQISIHQTQAQTALPDFKTMMSQGVPYDSIKVKTEAAIKSSTVLDTTEGGELNKYKRWLNYWEPRISSQNNTNGNTDTYAAEINKYYNLYQCNSINTPKWKFRGPTDIRDDLNNPICVMGRVNAVAMHPDNLNIMYAGTSSGGIWKTTNAQDAMPNWINISDGYGFDNIGVTDIAINPQNPNRIYVSTAHVSYGYGIGILISNDGGNTWEKSTLEYFNDNPKNYNYVSQLRVNYADTNIIHGLYNDSVIVSTDAGQSWQNMGLPFSVTGLNLKDIELNKSDPSIVYVAGKQIWRKQGANSWTRLDNLPSFNIVLPPGVQVLDRSFHISADSVGLYCLVQTLTNDTAQYGDNRKHWFKYHESQNKWVYKRGATHFCEGIAVSSVDTNIIYYWDLEWRRRVGKSVDEGASFENQSERQAYTLYNNSVSEHMDIRDFQLVKGTNGGFSDVIIFGTDGGITFSKQSKINMNEVIRENKTGEGLNITELYGITSVKYEPELVSLGAQDNSTFTLVNSSWNHFLAGDAYDGFITPNHIIYAQREYPYSVLSLDTGKSYVDRGITFTGIKNNSIHGNGFVKNPSFFNARKRPTFITKNEDVYIGRYDLAKKVKGDSNYIFISDFHALNVIHNFALIDVSVYEQNDNIIFAAFPVATFDSTTIPNKKLFRTVDGGVNWTDISNSSYICDSVLKWQGVKSLIVHPRNPNILWVTFDGIGRDTTGSIIGKNRVVWTENALAPVPTWKDYSEGLPVFPMEEILFDESSNGRLYVASDVGVFYRDSDVANSKWECFNNGIPDITVSDIDINYCNRTIYAATHGRGLWSADLLTSEVFSVNVGSVNGVIWNSDTVLRQSITIKPAHKLTINNATVKMMAGAKIIVDQGAELVLNGVTITNECGAFWGGIEVWGDSEFSSSTQFCPSGSSCLTGKLTMNNSTLSNADNAVSLWNPKDWTMRGGMVYAYNSNFLNNRRDVAFMAYENHTNSGSTRIRPYRSEFTNCTFKIDNNFRFDRKQPFPARVTMWQVRGVPFNGCTFINETDNKQQYAGIYSWDANYIVKETVSGLTTIPTSFEGFSAGIDATSTGLGYSFVVDTTHFTNCLVGIAAMGVNNPVITRNVIKQDGSRPTFNIGSQLGIALVGADQFLIQENNIDNCYFGVMVAQSGGAINNIYNNGIENSFYGNSAYGDNNDPSATENGLKYSCNIHKNPGIFDILVYGGSGISAYQGSMSKAADNSFTAVVSPSVAPFQSIANPNPNAAIINYYHHQNSLGYTLDPPAVNPNNVVKHGVVTIFNPNNNCLSKISHFKNGGLPRGRMTGEESSEKRAEFNTAKTNFNQAKYVYTSTIDGGDTYALLHTVQTTDAQGAWQLRTDLINNSPLSDDVIIEIIEQDVLSNALLLDVLMVNGDASRNAYIINLLETKATPMPAYMLNTFLGLFGSQSQKDILLSQMTYENGLMHGLARILTTHWYADSTGNDLDSIAPLLAELANPLADLQSAAFLRGTNNTGSANELLGTIPANYTLTPWQQSTLAGVQNIYGLYDTTTANGLQNVLTLPTGVQSNLEQLSVTDNTRETIYAKAWLKFSKNELYLPEIVAYTPMSNKKESASIFKLREVKENAIFKVYPNPVKEVLTVAVETYEPTGILKVQLLNSLGTVVLQQRILVGITNINTSSLATGIYILRIMDGDKDVQNQTIEIIK